MKKTNSPEPINQFLTKNIKRKPVSFHMPGHKYGRFPYGIFPGGIGEFDITEIPGAGNIHGNTGIIVDSLRSIAEAYGSIKSCFLTNGSTGGIHTIVKYLSFSGKKLIISRDCHTSVVNGAVLFNVPVEFIPIKYSNGIPEPVKPEDIAAVLDSEPEAGAVLVTSPNYYGNCADLNCIRKLLDERNIILAVDEAHGAHFAFSGMKKLSGLANGADFVVHSLHKTMPVLNQGAILHANSRRIDIGVLDGIASMLGTTSPSYPILASMEKAVSHYRKNGQDKYSHLHDMVAASKKRIRDMGYKFLENDDFTRLVIDVSGRNISGFRALDLMNHEGVCMESSDSCNVIGIATPSNIDHDFNALQSVLSTLEGREKPDIPKPPEDIPERKMNIHDAMFRETRNESLNNAAGSICGTIIIPYPPGIPCLYPGEVITGNTALYIERVIMDKGVVLGLEKGMIPVLE